MGEPCCDGVCSKCSGAKYIVTGLIVLLTVMYWPLRIWHVLAVLLILKGLVKLVKPTCGHCQAEAPVKKGKK